tara:strand:- start:244 stop:615 length:372 start_codon:yes stop_codon:yes gene_type:complete
MKLEAGKTYVFKDDAARDEFLTLHPNNKVIIAECYLNNRFLVGRIDFSGDAEVGLYCISKGEFYLFKESEPFDIGSYEFSGDGVRSISLNTDEVVFNHYNDHQGCHSLSVDDVKALAKHFKLI